MGDPQETILRALIDFVKHGKGIDKGFGALLLFFLFLVGVISLQVESEHKGWFLILIGILVVFAFEVYAKHKGKSTIQKESEEDLKEGLITKKTYEKIVHEK